MPDPTKAAHYIEALDAARVEGNWAAVPEFVRKIRKHAPDRACLTLTAETEHSISTASKSQSSAAADRPSTALAPKDVDANNQLPKLLAAIDNEDKHFEDRYQAQVCVGWLHWTLAEFTQAAARLPSHIGEEQVSSDGAASLSKWTQVCALKAAYLKADCLRVDGQKEEALAVFETALPSLTAVWTQKNPPKQLRYCSELFLTEFCMLQSRALQANERSIEDSSSLGSFRSWAKYWDAQGASAIGGHGFRGSVPRRRVWSEYYMALSSILDRDLPLPTSYADAVPDGTSDRTQLRVELKKAEAAYEALLIGETRFPRADEERQEVESFVKTVVANWAIMCGRAWREEDLGSGGREALSRGVLDLLYRAATRTYHSTAILRCLFTVHLAVAEFDLAFKAFDSYLDLVKHGKARVDKTGHPEAGLDDDGMVLEAMAQCILALCRFGGPHAAVRARDLGSELEDWMARLPQLRAGVSADSSTLPELEETTSALHPAIPPSTIGLAWQAIGLSQAHWSRVTYDAASRTEIQTKAIRCLRRAVSPELGRSKDVRSLFALGLLLAERRDLSSSIEVVRAALISNKSSLDDDAHQHGPFWQERSLVPLWHLLALLLSARQDFAMAARSCDGAFEQFRDPDVLFGIPEQSFKSDHLNELEAANEKNVQGRRGVVDDMEDFEKESILEVKMTQLVLVELLEGPDVAVNSSLELLTLFSRLFGDVQAKKPTLNAPSATEAPRSSAGTLRSIKGSIFGNRSVRSNRTARQSSVVETEKSTTLPTRPQTMQTATATTSAAPSIHVTGENGTLSERRPSRKLSSSRRGRSDSTRRNSLRKRDSSASRGGTSIAGAGAGAATPLSPTVVDGETFFTPLDDSQTSDLSASQNRRQPPVSAFTRGSTLTHLDSYATQASKSTAFSFSEISADATYTITTPLPIIQVPEERARRQRTAILVKVWLMIAGFYRRAEVFEDGKVAVGEAEKLVQGLEAERDALANGASPYKSADWGVKKTVEELWADVWAEMGSLSVAQDAPYKARTEFETALTHFPNHPTAIVGLSNILLDIYDEQLLPPPTVPKLTGEGEDDLSNLALNTAVSMPIIEPPSRTLPLAPIGLGGSGHDGKGSGHGSSNGNGNGASADRVAAVAAAAAAATSQGKQGKQARQAQENGKKLPAPYKATSLPLLERLAARDRATGLLTGLTKLGSAWDDPQAWFALARAHEESGLPERAKEVLWWCVELEEGRGVREWRCLGSGGYVL